MSCKTPHYAPHTAQCTLYTHPPHALHTTYYTVGGRLFRYPTPTAPRRTECGNGQAEGCYVPPSGKRPRKWTSQGPKAAVGERPLTAGLG